jgi:hypothetical protein
LLQLVLLRVREDDCRLRYPGQSSGGGPNVKEPGESADHCGGLASGEDLGTGRPGIRGGLDREIHLGHQGLQLAERLRETGRHVSLASVREGHAVPV